MIFLIVSSFPIFLYTLPKAYINNTYIKYMKICMYTISTLTGVLPLDTIFITLHAPAYNLINYHHSVLVGFLEMKAKVYNFFL